MSNNIIIDFGVIEYGRSKLVINEKMNPSGNKWTLLIDAERRTIYLTEDTPYEFIPFKPADWNLERMPPHPKAIDWQQQKKKKTTTTTKDKEEGGAEEEEEPIIIKESAIRSLLKINNANQKQTNLLLQDIKLLLLLLLREMIRAEKMREE